MADLETHLMHYALGPNYTLVLMGDMNIDLCTREDDDGPALRPMMTRLGLISCAEARWPDSHRGFLTRRAGEGQAHSHIDSILSFRKPPIRGSVTNCVSYFGDPSHRSVGLKWARRAGGSETVARS